MLDEGDSPRNEFPDRLGPRRPSTPARPYPTSHAGRAGRLGVAAGRRHLRRRPRARSLPARRPMPRNALIRARSRSRNWTSRPRAARSKGKVDAIAARVGTLNAHLIRLDALGRRLTDLAGLDRGEFDFDKPPPAGGPGRRAAVRRRLACRCPSSRPCSIRSSRRSTTGEQQLVALESLLATRAARPAHHAGRPAADRRLDFVALRLSHRSVHRARRVPRGRRFRGAAGHRVIAVGSGRRFVFRLQIRLRQRGRDHAPDRAT